MTQSRKTTIIVLFLSSILSGVSPCCSLHFTRHSTSSYISYFSVFFFSFFFYFRLVWTMMTLSGLDNQDWEEAVSGWAEVTQRNKSFSQWSSCSWCVFFFVVSSVIVWHIQLHFTCVDELHTHAAVADNGYIWTNEPAGCLLTNSVAFF